MTGRNDSTGPTAGRVTIGLDRDHQLAVTAAEAHGATPRLQIVAFPARRAVPNAPILHLPAHRPWAKPWINLWRRVFGTETALTHALPEPAPTAPPEVRLNRRGAAGEKTSSTLTSTHHQPRPEPRKINTQIDLRIRLNRA